MRISMRVVQRLVWIGAAIQVLAMVTGCGNMPREYRKMAEPNVAFVVSEATISVSISSCHVVRALLPEPSPLTC